MPGKLKYRLEVLTPVHIGSGQKLLPADYILDPETQEVIRVDLNALFSDRSFPVGRFIAAIKEPGFSLQRKFYQSGRMYPLYRLAAAETLNELNQHIGRPAGAILEHIKEAGQPYLPGSSLKGALRSLVVRYLIAQNPDPYEKRLRQNLQDKRSRKEFFSTSAEEGVVGNPNFSLFKSLQVSDSSTLNPNQLQLGCTRVLSLTRRGFCWKDLGQNTNVDRPEMATPIFFEAISAGTTLTGTLKVDETLLKGEMAQLLRYPPASRTALLELTRVCREGSRELLRKEEEFFTNISFDPGVQAVKDLLSITQECNANQMIIPLAWGTGYLAKAMGWKIDPELFQEVRDRFKLGRSGFEFPKSRKIVFTQGRPSGLMGWVKITLGEE